MTVRRSQIRASACRKLVEDSATEELTYDTVGMSLPGNAVPDGYSVHEISDVIGTGEQAYRNAGYHLMHWQIHTWAKLYVQAAFEAVRIGEDFAVAHSIGPLAVCAPARVVEVIAEPRRSGFSAGTLPNHPEIGEETLLLTHLDDDRVQFTVRAVARPASLGVKLAFPVARSVQRTVGKRLVEAARTAATVPVPVAWTPTSVSGLPPSGR